MFNALEQDGRAGKNWQTIRTRKGNWIIAKVTFVGFIKWLRVLHKTSEKISFSGCCKTMKSKLAAKKNQDIIHRSTKSKPRLNINVTSLYKSLHNVYKNEGAFRVFKCSGIS